MFDHPAYDAHEGGHMFHDAETGLRGMIAIHSTHLGPAAGGCRMWNYETGIDMYRDVLRLSQGMSYKNAMAGLPLGAHVRDDEQALFLLLQVSKANESLQ